MIVNVSMQIPAFRCLFFSVVKGIDQKMPKTSITGAACRRYSMVCAIYMCGVEDSPVSEQQMALVVFAPLLCVFFSSFNVLH